MKRLLKTVYYCFPGGKHKALTMSYDDGQIFDRKLVDIFNRYGLKGTFHLNAGIMEEGIGNRIDLSEIPSLYAGHEVSSHTYTHPTIGRCPLDQVVRQVIEDRKTLEKYCGYPVRGMSYPNGSYSEDIKKLLPACGIEYSRIVGDSENFALPRDFLEWKSTCHHGNPRLMQLAKTFCELSKKQYLYLMYVWGHSYEFDRDNSWSLIEGFAEYMGGRDDIWYATNIEIVDYINAAKNLKFTADSSVCYNPSAMSVFISVDNNIIEVRGGETVRIDAENA